MLNCVEDLLYEQLKLLLVLQCLDQRVLILCNFRRAFCTCLILLHLFRLLKAAELSLPAGQEIKEVDDDWLLYIVLHTGGSEVVNHRFEVLFSDHKILKLARALLILVEPNKSVVE